MLPQNFKPFVSSNLVRVGRRGDGGYLVDSGSVPAAEILISMGISTDWSFEEDFLQKHQLPVVAFDHSIDKCFWRKMLKNSFRRALFGFKWKKFIEHYRLYKSYQAFFQSKAKHVPKMIGLHSMGCVSVKDILETYVKRKKVFFKIDIEGSEYRILDELVACADQTVALAIEFHDVDLHASKIERFIKDYPLKLVHTHANNWGGVDNNGDPLVLEMTFTKEVTSAKQDWIQPHPADDPNNLDRDDLILKFRA